MNEILEQVMKAGDTIGGAVECIARHVPVGLGDPVYGKIEAKLAAAMMSLPASKAFEIGEGREAARMRGSEHNDLFCHKGDAIGCETNHAGGVLGGITTGEPIVIRVFFKPASTIRLKQRTVDVYGNELDFAPPAHSRHDPCVAIRAVPVVSAMMALVVADCLLLQRTAAVHQAIPLCYK